MRATGPVLTIFAAICIAAAGCSGGTGSSSLPFGGSTASNAASGTNALSSDSRANPCRGKQACKAELVAPLHFNGSTFTIERRGSCKNQGTRAARAYTASTSGQFKLSGNVSLPPVCTGHSSSNTQLFLAVAPLARSHKGGGNGDNAIDVSDGLGKASFVPLGGPADWNGKPWTFAPMGSGISMKAHAKYVFYVVSVVSNSPTPYPSATPATNYVLLQPLNFDGTNFSVVPNSCFNGDPNSAPPYTAPTSGPLTVNSPVQIAPTCVPSPLPSYSPLPQLYIVAVDLDTYGDNAKHPAAIRRVSKHTGFKMPMDDWYDGIPAVAVAGGVNVTDNPWNFAADIPGLTMTAGTNYGFFIAAPLPPAPPTPPPTQSYTEVVPLSFDGTNFTVPTISDCTNLPTAAPYTAPTSGPLTLAGSVTITPTCPPSSSGYGYGGGGGDNMRPATGSYPTPTPAPLYIVAVASCNNGGYGYGGGGGDNAKRPHDGGGDGGNCNGGGYGGGGGDNAKHRVRPHDGGGDGNCNQGGYGGYGGGGGDNAKHPHDGGGDGNGCTIDGFAIAGPVNTTDNPWVFAPITPALMLTGGQQYTFYVGQLSSDQSGGGDNGDTRHHR